MGRGGSSGWLRAHLPSHSDMILLGFFCVLWGAVFHLFFQSRLVDVPGPSSSPSLPVAAATASPSRPLQNIMQAAVAAIAADLERKKQWFITRTVLEWAEQYLPPDWSTRSFLVGLFVLPLLKLFSAGVAWLIRRCWRTADATDGVRPRRSSQMDQMYSVNQPARVLLNLQLGETWMNFGYWGAQAPLDLRPASSAPGLGPGRPGFTEACRSLVRVVAAEAKLCRSDRVLDVGCGAGEQDILWRDEYKVACIVAIDPVEAQINIGRRRVEERGLSNYVSMATGSVAVCCVGALSLARARVACNFPCLCGPPGTGFRTNSKRLLLG